MPDVQLPAPGRPHVVRRPAGGGSIAHRDTAREAGVELGRMLPQDVRQGLAARRLLHLKPTWPELLEFWLGDPRPSDALLANPPSRCPYAFERRREGVICSFSRPALNRPMFADEP